MKKLFLFIFSMLSLPILAQTTSNATLVLHHADGTTTDIALFTQPRVMLTEDKLLITSPVLNLEYPAEEILRFTYKGEGTGIVNPLAETEYSQHDGQILFNGITSADRVALYTTNGIRVSVHLVEHGNEFALPLKSIPQGVYILSVNGKTSKITKR